MLGPSSKMLAMIAQRAAAMRGGQGVPFASNERRVNDVMRQAVAPKVAPPMQAGGPGLPPQASAMAALRARIRGF